MNRHYIDRQECARPSPLFLFYRSRHYLGCVRSICNFLFHETFFPRPHLASKVSRGELALSNA